MSDDKARGAGAGGIGSVCSNCGASVRLPAAKCWMCQAPLLAVAPTADAPPRDDASATLALIAIALVCLILGVVFMVLFVGAPGLALGFAVIALPLVGGLGAVAFAVQSRRSAPAAASAGASGAAAGVALDQRGDARNAAPNWIDSAAKAMVIVLAIILGLAGLAVAAIVILATVCFAILSSSGMH